MEVSECGTLLFPGRQGAVCRTQRWEASAVVRGEQYQDGLWGLWFLRTVYGGDGLGSGSVGSELRQVREPLHEEFKLMEKVWAPRKSVLWDNIPYQQKPDKGKLALL